MYAAGADTGPGGDGEFATNPLNHPGVGPAIAMGDAIASMQADWLMHSMYVCVWVGGWGVGW